MSGFSEFVLIGTFVEHCPNFSAIAEALRSLVKGSISLVFSGVDSVEIKVFSLIDFFILTRFRFLLVVGKFMEILPSYDFGLRSRLLLGRRSADLISWDASDLPSCSDTLRTRQEISTYPGPRLSFGQLPPSPTLPGGILIGSVVCGGTVLSSDCPMASMLGDGEVMTPFTEASAADLVGIVVENSRSAAGLKSLKSENLKSEIGVVISPLSAELRPPNLYQRFRRRTRRSRRKRWIKRSRHSDVEQQEAVSFAKVDRRKQEAVLSGRDQYTVREEGALLVEGVVGR